jgi:hypothetical protein
MLASKKDNNDQPIDEATIQTIAMRIERATHNKILGFEGSSEQINKKERKPETTFVTGLGTRIRHYKNGAGLLEGNKERHMIQRFCLSMN